MGTELNWQKERIRLTKFCTEDTEKHVFKNKKPEMISDEQVHVEITENQN
jgi:hypothetical protein